MSDRAPDAASSPIRRRILKVLAAIGITSPVFARALSALAEEAPAVTVDMIRQAEWISGLELTEEKRDLMRQGVERSVASYGKLREVRLDNGVVPALVMDPFAARPAARPAPRPIDPGSRAALPGPPATSAPGGEEDVAFASVAQLSAWLRGGKITSRELTDLSLARLERYDPVLHCVIELTRETARTQAERADAELARGEVRGPLHGVPWGAKDLLAWPGARTTWGAKPYENQVRAEKAAVAERLEEAGAVLVAKLAVGALAWGDVWFGGKTRNPWDPEQGSSGSSAGPGSATSAGLVPFAIGTETWGSILSPSTVCGVTGLRPTFGRVSRHGCMALSWSMDKIGPLARNVGDCAHVFAAIHGADGRDPAARDVPFAWPPAGERPVRLGVLRSLFDHDRSEYADSEDEEDEGTTVEWWKEWEEIDGGTLEELAGMGFDLVDLELPDDVPIGELAFILTAEAATAFDDLTRSGRSDLLTRQVEQAWPNVFRQGQLIPAVEYLRANRVRTQLMAAAERLFEKVDVIVAPTWVGDTLLMTNLTGHPQIGLPNGFHADGTPTSISFVGRLDGEAAMLRVARDWQDATGHHRPRPPGFGAG